MKPASYTSMNTSAKSSTVNRVATGKFGAGRYDFKINSEADIDLDDMDDTFDEFFAGETESEAQEGASSGNLSVEGRFTPNQAEELLSQFSKRSRITDYVAGGSGNADDVASEALLIYLEGTAKNWEIRDHEAMMTSLVQRTRAELNRSEHEYWNRKAVRSFNRRVALEEDFLQRPLTAKEKKVVSEEVRMSWVDQSRRPAEDFHLQKFTYSSIDNVDGASAETEAALVTGLTLSTPEFEGPLTQKALDLASGINEDGELPDHTPRGAKVASAKFSWNALAEISNCGLPVLTENSLSKRQRTEIRAGVKGSGFSVSQIANQWDRGARNAATAALFAPFGTITESEKASIADTFIEHSGYAEELWDSLVTFTTRGH